MVGGTIVGGTVVGGTVVGGTVVGGTVVGGTVVGGTVVGCTVVGATVVTGAVVSRVEIWVWNGVTVSSSQLASRKTAATMIRIFPKSRIFPPSLLLVFFKIGIAIEPKNLL